MEYINQIANRASIAGISDMIDEQRATYYPKNETEKRMYEALGNQNWGASTTLMTEIANDTFQNDCYQIVMALLWENCLDKPEAKTWKHLFKGLTLLEFLIKNGNERVVETARDKLYRVRQLEHYNFYEQGADKGSGVREMAAKIIELLGDNDRIREEREKANKLREKFGGIGGGSSDFGGRRGGGYGNRSSGGMGGFGGGGYDDDRRGGGFGSDSRSGGFGSDSRGFGSDSRSGGFGSDSRGSFGGSGGGGGVGAGGRYSDGGIDSDRNRGGGGGGSNYGGNSAFSGGGSGSSRYSDKIGNSGRDESNDGGANYGGGGGDGSGSSDAFDEPFSSKSAAPEAPKRDYTESRPFGSSGGGGKGKVRIAIKKVGGAGKAKSGGEADLLGGPVDTPAAAPPAVPTAAPTGGDLFDPFTSGGAAPAAPVAPRPLLSIPSAVVAPLLLQPQ